ncbi:hypothetical protein SAMN04487881_2265 [Marinobacter sp. es.048]|uniref:hypothetical protein n=1 Tax=Marinobacter sp. es.048 TaxID=1761795 RepID=UPI000B5897A4|nr:hypothetical protein [Marinobacter sp. es.048]SNC74368.1 hypothetical protein SAMN04487881_2265 [Marinobacter sp. es.048]
MIISNINSRKIENQVEVSALIDGYRLWYRFPANFSASLSVEPFLVASFFVASRSGQPVEVKDSKTASPRLLANFKRLQCIFGTWKRDLRPFTVNVQAAELHADNAMVCSFFSGGVDSLYTLINNESEITHLVYINGFDFHVSPEEFAINVQRLRDLSAPFEKEIIPVETNFFDFDKLYGVGRHWSHGASLASVALLLQPAKCIVPTTFTYRDLRPWGTHPLTDNLWSTEVTEILHDTADRERPEKIRKIAERSQAVLDSLVVCWTYPDKNCGQCIKCIRTMIILKILGIETNSFPGSISPEYVSRLSPSEHYRAYFEDLLRFAREQGDESMVKALQKSLSVSMTKKIVKLFDDRYLNGSIRSGFRYLQKKASKA